MGTMSFKAFHVLPNKTKMPIIGIGTWQATNPNEVRNAVDYALQIGYRHIDTAAFYGNEAEIGDVLKKWFESGRLKREDVFITTKLPEATVDRVEYHLKMSLRKLQLDHVDLYLIHWPTPIKRAPAPGDRALGNPILDAKGNVIPDVRSTLEQTWAKMEEQVDLRRTKEIGISNFNPSQVERIAKVARIMPATNQVELHAHFQQRELREMCGKYNIHMTSYASLGSYGRSVGPIMTESHHTDHLLQNAIVKEIARHHNKTVAQVLLRHLVQEGIIVIPKSVKQNRIKENFEIFDFELSAEELQKLDALDKGYAGRSFQFTYMKGNHLHPEFPYTDVAAALKK